MKRFKRIYLPIILGVLIVFLILKHRGEKRMEKIARNELENYLGEGFDTTNYNVKGPIICKSKKERYTTFQWYKVLSWGDTASIFIDVPESLIPFSLKRLGDFILPGTTMNYQWYYLMGPISKLKDVLPIKYKKGIPLNAQLKLYQNHKRYFDSSELTIAPNKLFFYLKEGYFRPLKKEDDYTVVEFYEPIGNVFYKNGNKQDTTFTLGAKVFVNEAFEILIVPYKIPEELY